MTQTSVHKLCDTTRKVGNTANNNSSVLKVLCKVKANKSTRAYMPCNRTCSSRSIHKNAFTWQVQDKMAWLDRPRGAQWEWRMGQRHTAGQSGARRPLACGIVSAGIAQVATHRPTLGLIWIFTNNRIELNYSVTRHRKCIAFIHHLVCSVMLCVPGNSYLSLRALVHTSYRRGPGIPNRQCILHRVIYRSTSRLWTIRWFTASHTWVE